MKENKIKSFFHEIKTDKRKLLISLLIFLAVFCVFAIFVFGEKKDSEVSVANYDYVSELENKLSHILSKIEGAGKVSVMITVESGMETVLASKTTITESGGKVLKEETPIIVNGKTVVIKENFPKIAGVLIIAEGANKISVLNKIQQATVSVLDVDLKRVEILSMK